MCLSLSSVRPSVNQLLCLDEATECIQYLYNPAHHRADHGNPAHRWLIGGH